MTQTKIAVEDGDLKHLISKPRRLRTAADQFSAAYEDKIVLEVPLDQIHVKDQVRKSFDPASIEQLSKNIEQNGLLHPIIVMKIDGTNYQLLVGENRYRAFTLLGREGIPCVIKSFIQSPAEIKLIQLTENIQRNNLNPVEIADALMAIKKEGGYTLKEVGEKISLSEDSLKRYSRISQLTNQEKEMVVLKKMGIKKIQNYLSSKKSVTRDTFEPKSRQNQQLNLFSETKTGYKIRSVSLDFKKESKQSLEQKIEQLKQVIFSAEKRLAEI